jgi:hypothetical protein
MGGETLLAENQIRTRSTRIRMYGLMDATLGARQRLQILFSYSHNGDSYAHLSEQKAGDNLTPCCQQR